MNETICCPAYVEIYASPGSVVSRDSRDATTMFCTFREVYDSPELRRRVVDKTCFRSTVRKLRQRGLLR